MKFTTCQAKALHVLHGDQNVFLTGPAGTGKSFVLQQFLYNKPRRSYPILASTGTAALLVDGRTFHSFFGIGIVEGGKDATVARVLKSGRSASRIRAAECIVIDEVSMLSGETLATAEEIARHVRDDQSPWGGLRIIAVGDFAQLPPVQNQGYNRDWAFCHSVWANSYFHSVYLQTPVRTTDAELLSVLHSVRIGDVSEEVRQFLDSRSYPQHAHFDGTRLVARRSNADAYNRSRLDTLPGELYEFATEYSGDARSVEQLRKQCPVPEVLAVKIGALVMLRKNDTSFPGKYANGSLGTIRAISKHTLTIELYTGKTIMVEPETFSLLDGNGKERASAENFPIGLAWATTIHKAQGASIDRLLVSVSGLWESGHAYVALSRATNAEGLYIEQWEPKSILIDPLVHDFYQHVQAEWKATAQHVPDTEPVYAEPIEQKPKQKKIPKYKQTASLLQEKCSLQEIAAIVQVKESTILQHIEKIMLEEIEAPDIHHLRPAADVYDPITQAFSEHGVEYLKPIYEACHKKFSYDELRLVRLFLL